jgi:hypothetical protein
MFPATCPSKVHTCNYLSGLFRRPAERTGGAAAYSMAEPSAVWFCHTQNVRNINFGLGQHHFLSQTFAANGQLSLVRSSERFWLELNHYGYEPLLYGYMMLEPKFICLSQFQPVFKRLNAHIIWFFGFRCYSDALLSIHVPLYSLVGFSYSPVNATSALRRFDWRCITQKFDETRPLHNVMSISS